MIIRLAEATMMRLAATHGVAADVHRDRWGQLTLERPDTVRPTPRPA
jgi:hypothetical protein